MGRWRKQKTSLYFFFRKNLHLPQLGRSCSQLHSAQQLQEQAGLLSPRAWFAFPGPFPWSCSLPPRAVSWWMQLWHSHGFASSRVQKSVPQRLFQPPALLERPHWIQRALDGSPQPLHGYKRGLWAAFIQIIKTNVTNMFFLLINVLPK